MRFKVYLACLGVLALGLIGLWPSEAQVTVQYQTPGVHTLQVTIGASVTQITTTDTPVKQVMFQNNQTHSMRVGDSATTSSRGALLASGAPGGSMNFGPIPSTALNLNSFWVAGTQNDVIDVIYLQ